MTLELHRERPSWSHCTCCHGLKVNRTRFVSRDGSPHAMCSVEYAPHTGEEVWILVVLGKDGFFCRVRSDDEQFLTSLGNADESPWGGDSVLARMLSREEALAHPRKAEVFDVIDVLTRNDHSIENFFHRMSCPQPEFPIEHRFMLPDEVFALGDERDSRATIGEHFVVLDANRTFVRCLFPFEVERYESWNVGTWVEVSRPVADRVLSVWNDDAAYATLEFSGTLANDFGSLSLPFGSGTPVDVHVVKATQLPLVKSKEQLNDFEQYAVEHDFL